jgi:cell division protein FtsL
LVEKANQAVKEKENLEDQVQNLYYENETLTN